METGCPHNLGCILDAEGLASVAFIESNLGDPCPGDVDGDGLASADDFTVFASGFGCRL